MKQRREKNAKRNLLIFFVEYVLVRNPKERKSEKKMGKKESVTARFALFSSSSSSFSPPHTVATLIFPSSSSPLYNPTQNPQWAHHPPKKRRRRRRRGRRAQTSKTMTAVGKEKRKIEKIFLCGNAQRVHAFSFGHPYNDVSLITRAAAEG